MTWDGSLANLPLRTLPAGSALHHGTDCGGPFETPDGPAWFAASFDEAAYWAGWNFPAHDRPDGPRRVHAFVTVEALRLVDLEAIVGADEDRDRDEAWERLCLAVAGIEDELTRDELAAAFVGKGLAGWIGEGEVMLADPAAALRFLGRTPVPGANPLRPVPSSYDPAGRAAA